jgi:hypothetical protein
VASSAEQMVLELAQALADKDGFVAADALVKGMRATEKEDGLPPALPEGQIVPWFLLKARFAERGGQACRLHSDRIELLDIAKVERMFSTLQRVLHPKENDFISTLSDFNLSRIWWKAMELYSDERFTKEAITTLRRWAIHESRRWSRDLSEPATWLSV